jgi:predicted RNA-binding protein with PUA-like domain
MARQYWLVKSELDDYPFEQFKKDGRIGWVGVRNYQARNYMRDGMKLGDRAFFYHSNAEPSAAVGIAEVVKESYPDPTQFDPKSDYYDKKSTREKPTWMMVDLKFVEELNRPVSRDEMKTTKGLEKMALFKQSRLSIVPVTADEFEIILKLSKS